MAPERSFDPKGAIGAMGAMELRPGGTIEGRARVPGSKSQAQRALVCAGLAQGTSEIAGLSVEGDLGSDVRAALALVEAAGASVERHAPGRVRVTGCAPGPREGWSAAAPVSAGESGTLARFATAGFALCGKLGRWQEIRAEGTLRSRRSPALFDALLRAGSGVEWAEGKAGWPVRVRTTRPSTKLSLEDPSSSQEVSALWIALAARPGLSTLEVRGAMPSRPYLELTRRMLSCFGVEVAEEGGGASMRGPLRAPVDALAIEPDASSSSVLLAAGCLSGGRVEIAGLDGGSAQPDARVGDYLALFGCRSSAENGSLSAEGAPSRGAEVDLSGVPDLAPVLAAVAAAAAVGVGAGSRLVGLGTLPGKESSRIEVLARGLAAVGLDARAGPDSLEIRPGQGLPPGSEIRLDPQGDHRMAFAFALLGLVIDGVSVADPACVGKSWPGFWSEMERLGAHVVRKS